MVGGVSWLKSQVRSCRATCDRVGPSAAYRPRRGGRRPSYPSRIRAPPADGLVAPPRPARRRGTASGLRGQPVRASQEGGWVRSNTIYAIHVRAKPPRFESDIAWVVMVRTQTDRAPGCGCLCCGRVTGPPVSGSRGRRSRQCQVPSRGRLSPRSRVSGPLALRRSSR